MLFDGVSHQVPDIDPTETAEWLESFDAIVTTRGRSRARFLLMKLLERAMGQQVEFPATVSTPYANTIPADDEPWFPGDEHLERRVRAFIRWNAAVMVTRANSRNEGIGGHLSTYASSAALYEVGFNHFFRGKAQGGAGDQVFIQGHASPGIYARAFVEGRLSAEQLDNYRQEVGGKGLPSYPHPRLLPEFWEYPTVSMGLGPICAVYQAHINRYLHHRRLVDTSESRVWCFVGDGEMDEPESIGGLGVAGREHLDNLIFVVNCNLQRLDGPVRGNGKIIQELEAVFRGAGWNVIKVIWGSRWDELLARDVDGVLLDKMNTTVDGEFQKYAVESGAYIREHFFGPDPRLRKLVEHLSDEELQTLPRGGHDYRKLYAAYKLATEQRGAPTVILAKTVKGWTLGPEIEARNATHQIKKMTKSQLRALRDRLYLQDEIPDEALDADLPPYFRPSEGSEAYEYLMARRQMLGGPVPSRVVRPKLATLPDPKVYADLLGGSGGQSVSTTMAFVRLLRNLVRDKTMGSLVAPVVSDEARTFGLEPLIAEAKIYAPDGQRYTPVDAGLPLTYAESATGQLLQEGITEAGGLASFMALATSYATWSRPMLPVFLFYSMFGFQRVGDLLWALGDMRGRGILAGCTAGRTTLQGEGLQHDDGQSPSSRRPIRRPTSTTPRSPTRSPSSSRTPSRGSSARVRRTPFGTSPSTTRDTRCRRSRRGPTARRPERACFAASTGSHAGRTSTIHALGEPRSASRVHSGAPRWRPGSCWPSTGVSPRMPGPSRRGRSSGARPCSPSGGTTSTPRRPLESPGSPPSSAPRAAPSSRSPTTCVQCRTRSPVGCRVPSSRSGRTASACPTRVDRCALTSRSTPPTSSWPCSTGCGARARSATRRSDPPSRGSASTPKRRRRSPSEPTVRPTSGAVTTRSAIRVARAGTRASVRLPGVGVGGQPLHPLGQLPRDHLRQGRRLEHLAQAGPHGHPDLLQVHGGALVLGRLGSKASDLRQRAVQGPDHLGQADLLGSSGEPVAALGAALAGHHPRSTQVRQDGSQEPRRDPLLGGQRLRRGRRAGGGQDQEGPDSVIDLGGNVHPEIVPVWRGSFRHSVTVTVTGRRLRADRAHNRPAVPRT